MVETTQGTEWRCLGCHGRLVRVAASAVLPPQEAPADPGIVSSTIYILATIAEAVLEMVG